MTNHYVTAEDLFHQLTNMTPDSIGSSLYHSQLKCADQNAQKFHLPYLKKRVYWSDGLYWDTELNLLANKIAKKILYLADMIFCACVLCICDSQG